MSTLWFGSLLLLVGAVSFSSRLDAQTPPPDYSKEGSVVEQFSVDAVFEANGTGHIERYARIRIQSDAGIQQYGVLKFLYRKAFDRVEILDIHVEKPDGRIIATPESDAQEAPTPVAQIAPTYSDSRTKQVPVKGLGAGDVLVWRTREVHTIADIPGQFGYVHNFFNEGIVLDERLSITVPAGQYVKVISPDLAPEIREENNRRIYSWRRSQRELPKDGAKKVQPRLQPLPAVRLTTFKSWEEVGRWYAALQKVKMEVTPAVQAKAAELIRGLNTNDEKQRAIYEFVATKFRYISVSLGEGRYQPHSADEVLTNQYGDCKDKHTLLSALLSAAGIAAWPALVGAGNEFDPDFPSPGQFNHVVTYLPGSGAPVWLDTTPGVAPFGMLQLVLRDRKALVIPENGAASLMTTPEALPVPTEQTLDVKSKLSGDGTLTGRIDITMRGDEGVVMKAAFQATTPAQWTQLAQSFSRLIGFAGTVSDVAVDNPSNTAKPFHYSYNYERKQYPDWENRRILAPLPAMNPLAGLQSEKPAEPVVIGAPGALTYRATVALPEGYSAVIPKVSKLETKFADYQSSYLMEQGVLTVQRVLLRKKLKLEVSEWDEYLKFIKAIVADEAQLFPLTRGGGPVSAAPYSQAAAELVEKATRSIQNREFAAALESLAQAERLNTRQVRLWWAYGFFYGMQNQNAKGIEALQKEVEYHPENVGVYRPLAMVQKEAGRKEDAIQTLRLWVKAAPGNAEAALAFAGELQAVKRYGEAIEPLEAAYKSNPDNVRIEVRLLAAFLLGGRKAAGSDLLAKLRERKLDPGAQNDVAYTLVETGVDLALALKLAQTAVSELEEQLKQVALSTVSDPDLRRVVALGGAWDTLGWAYFHTGDLAKAEKFLNAAWVLLQCAECADHLGQLYERQKSQPQASTCIGLRWLFSATGRTRGTG